MALSHGRLLDRGIPLVRAAIQDSTLIPRPWRIAWNSSVEFHFAGLVLLVLAKMCHRPRGICLRTFPGRS
jgi:hypothetical protein